MLEDNLLEGYELAKKAVMQSIDSGMEFINAGVRIRRYNVIVRKYFVQKQGFEKIYDDFSEAWEVFVNLVAEKGL